MKERQRYFMFSTEIVACSLSISVQWNINDKVQKDMCVHDVGEKTWSDQYPIAQASTNFSFKEKTQ